MKITAHEPKFAALMGIGWTAMFVMVLLIGVPFWTTVLVGIAAFGWCTVSVLEYYERNR